MHEPADFPRPTSVPLDGVNLEVYEAGQQNVGNPIVLCHGWPEHAFSWRYQLSVLADAGYHVIVLNQRGYGNSSRPPEVTAYDIEHLAGDIVGLLDHYGYDTATVVGHDWGAMVAWWLSLLHPARVDRVIALSVPYQERGDQPWIEWMEAVFGDDFYFVHFNRQPGVADAVFDENTERFLRNLFRTNEPPPQPQPGMALIDLATREAPVGDPLMSEAELAVTVESFQSTGFTSSINWYRNLDRNWHLLADLDPIVHQPALMIYGDRDPVAHGPNLTRFVPDVEVVNLDCGHWIQQEKPEAVNRVILDWLDRNPAG
ncbi:alpha/beta fold hydrolase [Euzebya tangerina]|uniref:alpha/beta fold hydrolase n=1 Tax=Euzebya tangerina TaxID=591198 RepID=UPI000E31612C|nr:alpha/beta hydrolase [Euzebya tangerina]